MSTFRAAMECESGRLEEAGQPSAEEVSLGLPQAGVAGRAQCQPTICKSWCV